MGNKMKAFCVIIFFGVLVFLLSGCGYFESKEGISEWVKESLQTELQKNDSYKGLSIGEVILVRESFNKFKGYVEFKFGTDTEKANLTVILDGNQRMYNCEPPRLLILKRNLGRLGI